MHNRKRPPRRDPRYVQRIEGKLQRLEAYLERNAATVLSNFKREEGKPSARRLSRPLSISESAIPAVVPSAFVQVDLLGTYLGKTCVNIKTD